MFSSFTVLFGSAQFLWGHWGSQVPDGAAWGEQKKIPQARAAWCIQVGERIPPHGDKDACLVGSLRVAKWPLHCTSGRAEYFPLIFGRAPNTVHCCWASLQLSAGHALNQEGMSAQNHLCCQIQNRTISGPGHHLVLLLYRSGLEALRSLLFSFQLSEFSFDLCVFSRGYSYTSRGGAGRNKVKPFCLHPEFPLRIQCY